MVPYWKASNASKKWQLVIFDAVICSKLLYGLETLHLTSACLKKLDAFQLRCLRRILKIPPTFIDRANTNRAVLQQATNVAFPHQGDHREISLFSVHYQDRRAKLLGHIARASHDDPLRQISFTPDSVQRVQNGKQRQGRPRQNWLHYAKKYVFEDKFRLFAYTESELEDRRIYNAAINRSFKFVRARGAVKPGYADALLKAAGSRSRVGQKKAVGAPSEFPPKCCGVPDKGRVFL